MLWNHGYRASASRGVRFYAPASSGLPTKGWLGWVGLGGWLLNEMTDIHPTTNRRRVTSLVETNALPLNQITKQFRLILLVNDLYIIMMQGLPSFPIG